MRLVVGGWCHGKRAGRRAIRERKRPARFERRQVAERGVRPDGVVVVAPQGDLAARVVQGVEDLLVQQLIAQAAVEAFDERVLLGLAGINVVPGDVVLLGPFQDGGECPIFCVSVIWSMLSERSKDDDDFERTAGRTAEGLQAA